MKDTTLIINFQFTNYPPSPSVCGGRGKSK